MSTGFKMLRPTLEAQALSGLWANVNRPGYVDGYKAMSRWANDFIGMPGRFFSQLSKDLYANNRLFNGEFVLNGRRVDLGRITQPLLVAAANQDFIVPASAARSLMDVVSSQDVQPRQRIRRTARRPHLRILRAAGPPDPLAQDRRMGFGPLFLASLTSCDG